MKLLKFSAEWCNPCKQLDKFLIDILPEYSDIELVHMPVEENKDSAMHYNIRSVPTMIMIDEDNHVLRTLVGFNIDKVKPFLAGT